MSGVRLSYSRGHAELHALLRPPRRRPPRVPRVGDLLPAPLAAVPGGVGGARAIGVPHELAEDPPGRLARPAGKHGLGALPGQRSRQGQGADAALLLAAARARPQPLPGSRARGGVVARAPRAPARGGLGGRAGGRPRQPLRIQLLGSGRGRPPGRIAPGGGHGRLGRMGGGGLRPARSDAGPGAGAAGALVCRPAGRRASLSGLRVNKRGLMNDEYPYGEEHVRVYRETDGEQGYDWKRGTKILLLTTKGRRSGEERTTPLIHRDDEGRWVVVGSQGGAPDDPGWVKNIEADPDA